MIYPRDLAITLDNAAGVTMQNLAERHNMHLSRISQIVTATRRRVSGTVMGKEELGLLLARQYGPSQDLANTPESFYFNERGLSCKEVWWLESTTSTAPALPRISKLRCAACATK